MSTTYITVHGWVGNDVSFSTTANGLPVANFRLASTPQRRDREGVWQKGETNWFTVRVWREAAENVERSVRRGQPVVVTGRLLADTWERADGTTATTQVIEAVALGHDLTRGQARFERNAPQAEREGFGAPPADQEERGAGTIDVADLPPLVQPYAGSDAARDAQGQAAEAA